MELTTKGQILLREMLDKYGDSRGRGVFYYMLNSGKLKGVEKKKKKKKKN